MSSSFLKPSVTPATALATRLRARPWNLPSCGSSRCSLATSVPSSCAKTMPGGSACRIFPFGPCTSTASPETFTVTPFGIGMGFLPIRDIVRYHALFCYQTFCVLPDVAKDFAADARLLGGPSRHHAARSRQNRGAQPTEHARHVVHAEIDAASGAADALQPADHALAVRPVLQEHADHLTSLAAVLLRRRLDHPESLDIALVLEDPRNLRLQLAGGQVHTRVLGGHRVANARDHVCDWICHLLSLVKTPSTESPIPTPQFPSPFAICDLAFGIRDVTNCSS